MHKFLSSSKLLSDKAHPPSLSQPLQPFCMQRISCLPIYQAYLPHKSGEMWLYRRVEEWPRDFKRKQFCNQENCLHYMSVKMQPIDRTAEILRKAQTFLEHLCPKMLWGATFKECSMTSNRPGEFYHPVLCFPKTRDGNIWDLLKAFSAFVMWRDNGTCKNAPAKALKYYPQRNTCGTNPPDMRRPSQHKHRWWSPFQTLSGVKGRRRYQINFAT